MVARRLQVPDPFRHPDGGYGFLFTPSLDQTSATHQTADKACHNLLPSRPLSIANTLAHQRSAPTCVRGRPRPLRCPTFGGRPTGYRLLSNICGQP
jgi:hypothetical protein